MVISSKGGTSPVHTPLCPVCLLPRLPAHGGLTWPGLAWSPGQSAVAAPLPGAHQAGCGLNGLDHQITGQLMVEIRCKYARRPRGEL